MASDTKKDILKAVRQRRYLNKDFDSFKSDLLEYAKTYYKENINDFSDSSLGGMLLDFPSYVGDVMSFYMDHQFTELDPDTAVETANIEKLLLAADVDIVGASPALIEQSFYVEVIASNIDNVIVPDPSSLPVINEDTLITSDNGTDFILLEPVDFTLKKSDGSLKCDIVLGDTTNDGTPKTFLLKQNGVCVSGFRAQESFSIGAFAAFKEITLSNPNVTQIESVYDSLGNTYYEVESLSDDVVFKTLPNLNDDYELVQETLAITPAPYRYVSKVNLDTRTTTLTFGGGSADTIEDDVIPDPSTFALPMYGKKTFSRISINPLQLLNTKTLGVMASNATLFINYRYGGGLGHNSEPNTIQTIKSLLMSFPGNPSANLASRVRSSTQTNNKINAVGGEDPPTFDDLKSQITATKNSQKRIVTKTDLLARVYTMPSNFGRVFRASVRSNPNNPLATQLFIISRDANSNLIISPDTLKKNLSTYLNEYRMISDAIDILDAQVINLRLNFEIVTDPTQNKKIILQSILQKLQAYFNIKNFQIDQPLILQDISNLIFNNLGVITITNIKFENINGLYNNRMYSDVYYDVQTNTTKGMMIPHAGGIFEIKYPTVDIIGKAS